MLHSAPLLIHDAISSERRSGSSIDDVADHEELSSHACGNRDRGRNEEPRHRSSSAATRGAIADGTGTHRRSHPYACEEPRLYRTRPLDAVKPRSDHLEASMDLKSCHHEEESADHDEDESGPHEHSTAHRSDSISRWCSHVGDSHPVAVACRRCMGIAGTCQACPKSDIG